MGKLFFNIRSLYGVLSNDQKKLSGQEMKSFNSIDNAWILVEDGLISDFGDMSQAPAQEAHQLIDIDHRIVLPTYCDSHTHIVFAAPRDREFVDRINGLSYEEIAQRGGGILNSAKRLNESSEEEIYKLDSEPVYIS